MCLPWYAPGPVQVLAGGVLAAKAIVEATQHSLMYAVHYTWERLYRQLELRSLDTVTGDCRARKQSAVSAATRAPDEEREPGIRGTTQGPGRRRSAFAGRS